MDEAIRADGARGSPTRSMSNAKVIAILDAVPESSLDTNRATSEADKFRRLLARSAARFERIHVANDEWPVTSKSYDAYIVTGSPCSANEHAPWIARLSEFLRDAHARKAKLLGICFGHQLIAHALGGRVEPAAAGWQLGLQSIDITGETAWMKPSIARGTIYHINRDVVTKLPPGARLIAGSAFVTNEAYVLGENVLGLQGHPEQTVEHMRHIFAKLTSHVPSETLARAHASLREGEPDTAVWRRWIRGFLSI